MSSVHQIHAGPAARPESPVDLAAYCARIGYQGDLSPTVDVLRRLIPAHAGSITFEAIDVLLGRGVDLGPAAVDAKLIDRRRGGYCFEQNGLFRRVLTALGFEVDAHLARVRWNQPADAPPTPRSHMVLKVAIDGEAWLADVGFGSSVPTAPLRLATTDAQSTPNDVYRLIPNGAVLRLEVRIADAWLPVYDIDPTPQFDVDFEMANWFTSAHPASHFRHRLVVTRTTPEARYALLDNRLTIRRPGGEPEVRFLDADEIERTLAGTFALPVEPDWRPVIEKAAQAEH